MCSRAGEELRSLHKELLPLSTQNAATLERIHRRTQAAAGAEQAERIRLTRVAIEHKRQLKLRQLITEYMWHRQLAAHANQPLRAPKRKKAADDHGRSHHAAPPAPAVPPAPSALA